MAILKRLATKQVAANTAGKQALYTVPLGKKCVVTDIVIRSASATLANNNGTLKFGFNSPAADDWGNTISDITGFIDGTKVLPKPATGVAVLGNAAEVFGCIFSNNSVTANVTIEVFGYTYTG